MLLLFCYYVCMNVIPLDAGFAGSHEKSNVFSHVTTRRSTTLLEGSRNSALTRLGMKAKWTFLTRSRCDNEQDKKGTVVVVVFVVLWKRCEF